MIGKVRTMPSHTERLLLPNGEYLSTLIIGRAGSGKSYALSKVVNDAMRTFPESWRGLYISPKHEPIYGIDEKKVKPAYSVGDAIGGIAKDRLTMWYPDMDTFDEDLGTMIESLFAYRSAEGDDFSVSFILDDANIILNDYPKPAIKKLILASRSAMIRPVFVGHRAMQSKWLTGQTSHIAVFSIAQIEHKAFKERFDLDVEPYMDSLDDNQYTWLFSEIGETPVIMQPFPE
jgi:hypothetical protein